MLEGIRKSQKESGGIKRSQEELEGIRRSQEESEGIKKSWEDSEEVKRSQRFTIVWLASLASQLYIKGAIVHSR